MKSIRHRGGVRRARRDGKRLLRRLAAVRDGRSSIARCHAGVPHDRCPRLCAALREARHYALGAFLERDVYATRHRVGLLILIA